MRERHTAPGYGIRVVAGFAGNRKTRGHVFGLAGCFIIVKMASYALRAGAGILAAGVAKLAVEACMRTEQRESRLLMQLTHSRSISPTINGVTRLTLIPELSTVNISVTRKTL
jgi:hypothetical protein